VAVFRGGTQGQAPLRLQLSAPVGTIGRVQEIWCEGENSSGSASRPHVSRPSTIGVGAAIPVTGIGGTWRTPSCTLTDTFSVGPSLPAVVSGPLSLPIVVQSVFSTPILVGGQGVLGALLVYADASGGHTWTASIRWEER